MPLGDYIEIGVFSGKKDKEKPLYLKKKKFTEEHKTFVLTIDEPPTLASIPTTSSPSGMQTITWLTSRTDDVSEPANRIFLQRNVARLRISCVLRAPVPAGEAGVAALPLGLAQGELIPGVLRQAYTRKV